MSIPQEILQEFNKKYFKRDNQYYKLSELNIAFKYLKIYPLGGGFQTTIKLDDYFLNKWREGEYNNKIYDYDFIIKTIQERK